MKKKKIRLHPALLFLLLTLGIMIFSSIGSILNLEASYYVVNEATGDLTSQVVNINNLFNRTGLQYLISNMLNNFLNFAPLGNLIIGLLGVGVAYKSGLLNSLFKMIGERVPRKFLTFIVVLLGIIFSMFYEVGYVILIPLAAILFMNLGRHPSAGICAAGAVPDRLTRGCWAAAFSGAAAGAAFADTDSGAADSVSYSFCPLLVLL